jgi:hypothetical protein
MVLIVSAVGLLCPCLAQTRQPDLQAQRAAMKKLDFLVGGWAGELRLSRERGGLLEVLQTEDAQYESDGLVLVIEGSGFDKHTGEVVSRSLGVISYDDDKKSYRFRSWNDGRYVETELKLAQNGRGLSWRYDFADFRISHAINLNDRGEWIDPDHNRVIEGAVASGSHGIVTGGKDLLRLGHYEAIQMVRLADFLTSIESSD